MMCVGSVVRVYIPGRRCTGSMPRSFLTELSSYFFAAIADRLRGQGAPFMKNGELYRAGRCQAHTPAALSTCVWRCVCAHTGLFSAPKVTPATSGFNGRPTDLSKE